MPPPVAEFCETFTVLTPGVKLSNWVKLRPFNGRSFTCSLTTATPNSEVEVSRASVSAATTTVSLTEPVASATSTVAVWFTNRVTFDCTAALKPSLVIFRS